MSQDDTEKNQERRDFFISYTGSDRQWAEWIAMQLEQEKKYTVFIQAWDFRPGSNFVAEMDRAAQRAERTLLVLSPAYLESCQKSGYTLAEWAAAFRNDPTGANRRLVPVRIQPCEVNGLLGSVVYIDLVSLDEAEARERLLAGVQQGRAKPATVAFPEQHSTRKTLEAILNNEGEQGTRAPEEQQPAQTRKKSARPAPFPPVWNVPYRYAFYFTGRDRLVEQLFANFTSKHHSGTVPIQALSGLGGLGKTQTAVEYAYRYRQQYRAVLWMQAETEEELLASFKTAAELLKRPAAHVQTAQSLLASMQEWFRNTTDWLLILDNTDNITLVEPFLPKSARGHLLLTTRATAMGLLAQPSALPPLTPDDGALCILRRANYIPWTGQLSDASPASVKAARELSQLMDGLPLALEQAGAYIETTGRSVSGYLDLYRRYRPEIQSRLHGPILHYREPVAFAWNIAREMVQQENPAAIELLHLCAFLAPNAIPYDLFTKGAHLLDPTLGPVAANPLALDQAIALLRKHSLIKNEVDRETDLSRLIIHPVLQEILKDGMDPQTQRLWAQRVVSAVASALSFVEWQILQAHGRRCLSLIEHWKLGSPEADLIRQRFAVEHV